MMRPRRARYQEQREKMVLGQLEARDIYDHAVLAAMRRIPRHLFVPKAYRDRAYHDTPLPLGPEQTISQPYIVAVMAQVLQLRGGERVLEVGTGSGYEAAILSLLAKEVFSVEIDPRLCRKASRVLTRLDCANVEVICGDGYKGLPEKAPFDGIIVSAACAEIPRELVAQLAMNGRMILPIGTSHQVLVYIMKTSEGLESREYGPVRFVQMRN